MGVAWNVLIEWQRHRYDEATAALVASQRHQESVRANHEQAIVHCNDHRQRHLERGHRSVIVQVWVLSDDFLHALNRGVDDCRQACAEAEKACEEAQKAWRDQRRRLQSLEILAERHRRMELNEQGRREQRNEDETALQAWLRKEGQADTTVR